ncbi:techylectin-5B-like [Tubulanus polymorphus]|uniref:techylectin-5B-like n=1 Tax=Tubulanus polymorphus TaxID=672921 RepID=UPI003DA6A1AF
MVLIAAVLVAYFSSFDQLVTRTFGHVNIQTYTNDFRSTVYCGSGKILAGPTTTVANADAEIDCARECTRLVNCTGYNTESAPTSQRSSRTCQLTETPFSQNCSDLVDRPSWKFVYREPFCKRGGVLDYDTRICHCGTTGFTGQRCDRRAYDCSDVYDAHLHDEKQTIVQYIYPEGAKRPRVTLCQMVKGGTTIISNRVVDGDFDKSWDQYKTGFDNGNPKLTSYWIGFDTLYPLLNQPSLKRVYKLKIYILLNNNSKANLFFENFHVGSEASGNFTMTYSKMAPNVKWGDAMSSINGSQFSTRDKDHDSSPGKSCAQVMGGGWWYNDCTDASLHGLWNRMTWDTMLPALRNIGIKKVRMWLIPYK